MYLQLVRNLNLTALLICIHYCALSYRLRQLPLWAPPMDAVECYCYPCGHPPMDAVECYCYPCGHPPMDAVECYCSSSL